MKGTKDETIHITDDSGVTAVRTTSSRQTNRKRRRRNKGAFSMDRAERARIFMPFASLKGYYDLILAQEQGHEVKRELGDEAAEMISIKLNKLHKGSSVRIKYYETCSYLIQKGLVSRIDYSYKYLIVNEAKIWFDDIEEIEDYVPEGRETWL